MKMPDVPSDVYVEVEPTNLDAGSSLDRNVLCLLLCIFIVLRYIMFSFS